MKALANRGILPGLGTVLVGDDPASHTYVAGKHRDCAEVGIASIARELPADTTQAELDAAIDELNADPACTGYIVQLPLPRHLDEQRALERMLPAKDADGLHPVNLGRLVLQKRGSAAVHAARNRGAPAPRRCIDRRGRGRDHRSRATAGRPLGLLLSRRSENATVTACHTGTRDLTGHVRRADIIVAAAGVPGLITADMVKPGAVVLDVGATRVVGADGKARMVGDVHPDVREVAGHLAPMPGGVGPMTRAMLLTNVVEAAEGR